MSDDTEENKSEENNLSEGTENNDAAAASEESVVETEAKHKHEPVLSQDEIDALLGTIDSDSVTEVSSQVDPNGVRYRTHDFASQERTVSARLSGLFAVNERFIRNFRTSMMNLLRRTVDFVVVDLMTVKMNEYFSSLPVPSCMNIIRMRPLHGSAIILIDSRLVFALVDCLFGGGDRFVELKSSRSEFTQMEMRIVHLVLESMFADLSTAWHAVYPINFELTGFEINPQLINIATSNEMLVIKRFKLTIEERISGEIHVVMPYSMIEPIKATLEAGTQSDAEEINELWSKALREEIFDAPLDVTGNLAHIKLPLSQVSKLKKGDVIPVDISDFLTVTAEGIPCFRARFGVSRGNCSIKITGRAQRQ